MTGKGGVYGFNLSLLIVVQCCLEFVEGLVGFFVVCMIFNMSFCSLY